jgi:hypothetical protein
VVRNGGPGLKGRAYSLEPPSAAKPPNHGGAQSKIGPVQGDPTIIVTDDGVSLRDREGDAWVVRWEEVERIEAYKLDLITTDKVCLSLVARGLLHVVDEETRGWPELTRVLDERFALKGDWLDVVTHPAFATNRSILWDRKVRSALDAITIESDYASDGAFDLYVHGTTVENWDDMLALARGSFGVVEVSAARKPIGIRIGGLVLAGHWAKTEIMLSVQIASPAESGALLRFAVGTATLLARPVLITPKNLPANPIFSISPAGHVRYLPWISST